MKWQPSLILEFLMDIKIPCDICGEELCDGFCISNPRDSLAVK